METLLRHGGRKLGIVALSALIPLGCTATRGTPAGLRMPVRIAAIQPDGSIEKEPRDSRESVEPTADVASAESRVNQGTVAVDSLFEPAVESTSSTAEVTQVSSQVASTSPSASYSLDLASVLGLADGQNPQVTLARERINEAYAQVDRADILWVPSLRAGMNYNKHEGAIQDVAGTVFNTSRGALYGGLGAGGVGAGSPMFPGLSANFHLTDAIFQPKIARYQASSKQFAATTARNDVLSEAAVAYLELLRAEGRLAIAREAREKTQTIADLTGAFARVGQGAEADHDRMLAELAARDGDLTIAEESIQTASAKLAFLIHADPSVSIVASEPAVIPLNLTESTATVQELVAQGLSRRPELAEHRQLVGEACERLRREKFAPVIPSVLLGVSYGDFGGGIGSNIRHASDRFDGDVMAYWEVRNFGLGERSARDEAASRLRQAQWREVIVLDRIAQEVVEAHAQVESRRKRIDVAKSGIVAAERSFDRNLERIQNAKGLPIEVLQAVQALAQSRRDYLNAVIDHNVAQIRLCRATGWFEISDVRSTD